MRVETISFSINLALFSLFLTSTAFSQEGSQRRISEEKFVEINGIEQWITIKGESAKPAILFLHGGPGSPISPYSDNIYKEWEKDFIIVQWDQRGTGRTFGRNAPPELTPAFLQSNPLTVDQMASDGIEVTKYLIKHLGKEKIILFGTSWGSVLGIKMAAKRPDLYYAYVGHSQVVNLSDDLALYDKVYQMAQKNNDTASIAVLKTIGKPPYERAKTVGQLFRVVKKYERASSIPAPAAWFVESPGYDTEKDNRNRSDGDDYSFVNFVGDKLLGVQSMRSTVNFLNDHVDFKIPIYLIQGEADLLTPKEVTRNYFNKIRSPDKKYILLPNTAHGFNDHVVKEQQKIFKSIKLH